MNTCLPKSFFVYILEASDQSATYVGATVDVDHRLRQHNGEITGGAKATSIKVKQGLTWNRVCYVKNFPDWQSALQFEWRLKQLSRKIAKTTTPIMRRIQALYQLLEMEQPTTKAKKYSEWSILPEIVWTKK
jgi:structure-specific endonuclease subunit SLX1